MYMYHSSCNHVHEDLPFLQSDIYQGGQQFRRISTVLLCRYITMHYFIFTIISTLMYPSNKYKYMYISYYPYVPCLNASLTNCTQTSPCVKLYRHVYYRVT